MRSKNLQPSKRRLYERSGAVIVAGGLGIASLQGAAGASPNKAPTTQAAIDRAVQHRADKIGTKINKISSTSIPNSTQESIQFVPRSHGQTEMILKGDLGPAPHDKHKVRGYYILKVTGTRDNKGDFKAISHVSEEVDKPSNKDGYIYQFGMQHEDRKNPDSWFVNVDYAYGPGTVDDGVIDGEVGKGNTFDKGYFPTMSLSKFDDFSRQALNELNDVEHGHLSNRPPKPTSLS